MLQQVANDVALRANEVVLRTNDVMLCINDVGLRPIAQTTANNAIFRKAECCRFERCYGGFFIVVEKYYYSY